MKKDEEWGKDLEISVRSDKSECRVFRKIKNPKKRGTK